MLREFIRDVFELYVNNFTFLEIHRIVFENDKLYIFDISAQVDADRMDLYEAWDEIEFPIPDDAEICVIRLNTNYWLKVNYAFRRDFKLEASLQEGASCR